MAKKNRTYQSRNNLKNIRKKNGLTQEEAGEKFGVEGSYIARLETSRISLGEAWIERFCEGYGVTPNDIFPQFANDKIVNLGEVNAGRDVFIPEPWETIEANKEMYEWREFPQLRPNYFSLTVRGESMNMIAKPGYELVVNRNVPHIDKLHNRLVVANMAGGCTFKRLKINPLRLEPRSTSEEFETVFYIQTPFTILGVVEWIIANDKLM